MQPTSAVQSTSMASLGALMRSLCSLMSHQLLALHTECLQNEHEEQLFFESSSNPQLTKACQNAVGLLENDSESLVLLILKLSAKFQAKLELSRWAAASDVL